VRAPELAGAPVRRRRLAVPLIDDARDAAGFVELDDNDRVDDLSCAACQLAAVHVREGRASAGCWA
jgi:hypothetical protein